MSKRELIRQLLAGMSADAERTMVSKVDASALVDLIAADDPTAPTVVLYYNVEASATVQAKLRRYILAALGGTHFNWEVVNLPGDLRTLDDVKNTSLAFYVTDANSVPKAFPDIRSAYTNLTVCRLFPVVVFNASEIISPSSALSCRNPPLCFVETKRDCVYAYSGSDVGGEALARVIKLMVGVAHARPLTDGEALKLTPETLNPPRAHDSYTGGEVFLLGKVHPLK